MRGEASNNTSSKARERERAYTSVVHFGISDKVPYTCTRSCKERAAAPWCSTLIQFHTHSCCCSSASPPLSTQLRGKKKLKELTKKPSISLTRKWCRPPNRADLSLPVLDSHSSPTTSVRACSFLCAATKKQRDSSRESRDFAVPTLLLFLLTSIKKENPGVTTTFPQKPVNQKPTTQSSKQQQQPQHLSRQSRSPRKQQAHDRHRNNPNPR